MDDIDDAAVGKDSLHTERAHELAIKTRWTWNIVEAQQQIAAAITAAEDRARRENEWLRRLLRWCRPRLKHSSYQSWLDKYLAAGPTDAPQDEPALVQSALATEATPGEGDG